MLDFPQISCKHCFPTSLKKKKPGKLAVMYCISRNERERKNRGKSLVKNYIFTRWKMELQLAAVKSKMTI